MLAPVWNHFGSSQLFYISNVALEATLRSLRSATLPASHECDDLLLTSLTQALLASGSGARRRLKLFRFSFFFFFPLNR